MKLELKHLAPYLPYGLKIECHNKEEIESYGSFISEMVELSNESITDNYGNNWNLSIKPILRPIKEVECYFESLYGSLEHQDVTDYFDADFLESHDNIEIKEIQLLEVEQLPYGTLKVLLKHHFDVFGLIEKGLAIDINTLKQ